MISEYEPIEAFALLTNDHLDLAVTYDSNLTLTLPGPVLEPVPLRLGIRRRDRANRTTGTTKAAMVTQNLTRAE